MNYKRKKSFKEFYTYYLNEHSDAKCRLLHFIGSSLVLLNIAYVIYSQNYKSLWLVPLVGYGFAWIGHFVFEKNKPASFKQPFYSLIADFVMLYDFFRGRKFNE